MAKEVIGGSVNFVKGQDGFSTLTSKTSTNEYQPFSFPQQALNYVPYIDIDKRTSFFSMKSMPLQFYQSNTDGQKVQNVQTGSPFFSLDNWTEMSHTLN